MIGRPGQPCSPTPAAGAAPPVTGPCLLRLVGLLAVVVGCGAILLRLGAGELHVPLTSWTGFTAWLDATPPPTMAVAVVRYAALAAGSYLGVVLSVAVVLTAGGRVRAADRSLRLAPAALRRLVAGGIGVGLAAQTALAPGPAGAEDVAPGPSDDMAVMIQLGPEEDPGEADDDATAATGAGGDAGGDTWVVEPGDSFWSIAERLAADHGSGDVARYWERLLDANTTRLADPANPDLLFPGQELTLPH